MQIVPVGARTEAAYTQVFRRAAREGRFYTARISIHRLKQLPRAESSAASPAACGGGRYNRALLRAAQELAPAGMEIRVFDRLAEVPLFNEDVEAAGDPEPVRR